MRLRNVARDAPRLIHRENARQPGRNVCQGVNKQQTARPITATIQRTHVHVWNAYDRYPCGVKAAAPKRRGLLVR